MKTKNIKVQIISAFVDNDEGGNPAGVVLNADNLSSQEKLQVAKKVGLSETAFVSESTSADFKLDFFTPTKQIAHCGHATIATFSYLKQLGLVKNKNSSKETIDGNRAISFVNELAFMEQTAPKYMSVVDKERKILKSLQLTKSDLLENAVIEIVNTGNSFLIIPLKDEESLKNVVSDLELINTISQEFDLIGYYVFSLKKERSGKDVTTRMFAPRYGIIEEAATGMAAGPLACYLYDKLKLKKERFLIQQGAFMPNPSPSEIIVDLKLHDNRIKGLMAGGKGVIKSELTIHLD